MKKKIVQLLLIVVTMITVSSCSNDTKAPAAPPPISVSVYPITKQNAVYFDTYPATVTALNQIDLRAQVTGYITGIYFSDGQHVSKGQKLYDIDKQQYAAEYDNAVANLNVTKANLDKAQQDATRYTDLLKQDAIAKQVVDHAISDLQSAGCYGEVTLLFIQWFILFFQSRAASVVHNKKSENKFVRS